MNVVSSISKNGIFLYILFERNSPNFSSNYLVILETEEDGISPTSKAVIIVSPLLGGDILQIRFSYSNSDDFLSSRILD
jgi:hypothetical protein